MTKGDCSIRFQLHFLKCLELFVTSQRSMLTPPSQVSLSLPPLPLSLSETSSSFPYNFKYAETTTNG